MSSGPNEVVTVESTSLDPKSLPSEPASYQQARKRLLAGHPSVLAHTDLAETNLLLASGLPGAEQLDIPHCLKTLDHWAQVVTDETERFRPNFHPNPSCATEAQYRGYMLIKALRDGFGLKHYLLPEKDTGFIGEIFVPPDGSSGFEDSAPVFIHGLLGPRRIGSCSSLPVLYAAVGRRLGYPIKLALAVGHVFIRWDTPQEAFNLEGSGPDYINMPPGSYYVDKPRPWTEYEKSGGYYLRSIAPAEELAVFLSLRGACLEFNGHLDAARAAFAHASRLAPRDPMYPAHLRTIDQKISRRPTARVTAS